MTSHSRAVVMMLVAAFIAGLGWVLSKESIAGMPVAGFIGLRFLMASAILLPFCWRDFKKISRVMLLRALVIGCLMGSYMLIWIYALEVSDTLAEGGFILSLSMLFVPLISWLLFKERPVRTFWFSLPIAIIGLLFLSITDSWQQSITQILFLINALLLAVTFCLNSRYVQYIPVVALACIQLFCTGLMGSLISLTFETWPSEISWITWSWFASSVLVATCMRYLLQIYAQKYVNPTTAAFIMLLEPIWITFFSILWYDEQMPLKKVLGCVLILFALVIYRGFRAGRSRAMKK